MSRSTLSTVDLARSLRLSPKQVEDLLEASLLAGVVEKTSTGWRLSEWAERRFGQALQSLEEWS